MLSDREQERYNRHIILPGFGEEAQLKLKEAKVLVVGAGGLGCPALLYLAAAGVGTIGIIDDDKVSLSNLQRQVLFDELDMGRCKAKAASDRIKEHNPYVDVRYICGRLTAEIAQTVIRPYDVVIDGSDNFATRYLVNDACVMLNKPFVYGSIYKFEGQLSVFNYSGGPTYRCLFPEPPEAGTVPACGEIGVLGVLPGIIGSYQALEAIKIVTGVGEPLSGKLMVIDTLKNTNLTVDVARNPSNLTIDELSDSYEQFCGEPDVVNEVDANTLQQWLTTEDIQLIDVREQDEFEQGNIGGTNIPLSDFEQHLMNIDTNKKMVFVCQSGMRSKKAITLLGNNVNAFNLKGGLSGYSLKATL